MMKSTLINAMKGFVLGGGTGVAVALTGLALWTGTDNLNSIKSLVENHMTDTEQQVSAFMKEDYKVQVDSANKEISDYQKALEQANSNIDKLITAYEDKVDEYEQDMKDLQAEYDKMVQKINLDYKLDMNEVVEKANEQINNANNEVAETKRYVEEDLLPTSQIDEYIKQAKEGDKVNTGNDKSVHDISSIVPSEQQGE